RAVLGRARSRRARELVVAVRLAHATLLLERAAQRIVRVVVHGRQLEELPELGLCRVPPANAEVRDPERLADRGLVRLTALRLLERDGRLGGHAALQVSLALPKQAVCRLAHPSSSQP